MWPTAILLSKKRFNLNHTVLQAATFPNSTFLSNLCTSELTNSASNGTQTNCDDEIAANQPFPGGGTNADPPGRPRARAFCSAFKIIVFKGPDAIFVQPKLSGETFHTAGKAFPGLGGEFPVWYKPTKVPARLCKSTLCPRSPGPGAPLAGAHVCSGDGCSPRRCPKTCSVGRVPSVEVKSVTSSERSKEGVLLCPGAGRALGDARTMREAPNILHPGRKCGEPCPRLQGLAAKPSRGRAKTWAGEGRALQWLSRPLWRHRSPPSATLRQPRGAPGPALPP